MSLQLFRNILKNNTIPPDIENILESLVHVIPEKVDSGNANYFLVLAFDMYRISLQAKTQTIQQKMLNDIFPIFQKYQIQANSDLENSQFKMMAQLLKMDDMRILKIVEQFQAPLVEFQQSNIQYALILLEFIKLTKQQELLSYDSFYSFWLKFEPKPSIDLNNYSNFFSQIYKNFDSLKKKISWERKLSGDSSNLQEYFESCKEIKIDPEINFNDLQKIPLSLAKLIQDNKGVQNYYQQLKLNFPTNNLSSIYEIMNNSRVIDIELLRQVENYIIQQDCRIFELLKFYSNVQVEPSTPMCRYLNFQIKQLWKSFNINQRLSVIGYVFLIENLSKAPQNEKLRILDSEMISEINNFMIGIRMSKLSQDDKMKIYFLMNTYYYKEMLSDQFNESFKVYFQNYLSKQSRIISKFQQEVGQQLYQLNGLIESEVLLYNAFSLDFLIDKKIGIEVNGPFHYHYFLQDNKYKENKKTMRKQMILQNKGLKVINISYLDWAKHKNVKDYIAGLSLEQIGLLM